MIIRSMSTLLISFFHIHVDVHLLVCVWECKFIKHRSFITHWWPTSTGETNTCCRGCPAATLVLLVKLLSHQRATAQARAHALSVYLSPPEKKKHDTSCIPVECEPLCGSFKVMIRS